MEIKSNHLFCIFCKKVINLSSGEKSQYHANCWSAVRNYKPNNSSKYQIRNKMGNILKKGYSSMYVNIYHGLIKNNLGSLTVIPKRSLVYTVIYYLILLTIFILILRSEIQLL